MRHNVTGWVRNLPDGRVEAIFEGEKEDIDKVLEFCKKGPTGAKVTKIDALWQDFTGEFEDFKIK